MFFFVRTGLAALLTLAATTMAGAADLPGGKQLNSYRLQTILPNVCPQIGGTTTYNGHAPQCQLPTVTTGKTPTQTHIGTPHVAPVTTKH